MIIIMTLKVAVQDFSTISLLRCELSPTCTASLAKWLRHPPQERKILGSNPACARIFSGSSHTCDLKIGTPVAVLPGAWRYTVSTGTGWPSVSILWLGEVESLICNFCLSVAERKIVWADLSLRYTCCWDIKQPTNQLQHVCCCCLLVGCLMSQQQASASQGRICSDNFTCCHTEIEVADQTFYLTQSQYTDQADQSQCWPYNARRLAG